MLIKSGVAVFLVQYRAFLIQHPDADGYAIADRFGDHAEVLEQVEAAFQPGAVFGDAGQFQIDIDADQPQSAFFIATDAAGDRRADAARRQGLSGYEAEMREFLRDVLSAYEREGAAELGYDKLSRFLQVRYGSTADAKQKLGDLGGIRGAFRNLQSYLYRE